MRLRIKYPVITALINCHRYPEENDVHGRKEVFELFPNPILRDFAGAQRETAFN